VGSATCSDHGTSHIRLFSSLSDLYDPRGVSTFNEPSSRNARSSYRRTSMTPLTNSSRSLSLAFGNGNRPQTLVKPPPSNLAVSLNSPPKRNAASLKNAASRKKRSARPSFWLLVHLTGRNSLVPRRRRPKMSPRSRLCVSLPALLRLKPSLRCWSKRCRPRRVSNRERSRRHVDPLARRLLPPMIRLPCPPCRLRLLKSRFLLFARR